MQTTEQYIQLKTTLVKDCMTFSHTSTCPRLLMNSCVIVESLPKNNKMICSDKSLTCLPCTLTQPLFKTSVQALTTNEKVFKPYWNDLSKVISSHLWLTTKTDLLDSDLNSLSSSLIKTMEKSWFSTTTQETLRPNSQTTFSEFCTITRPAFQDLENTIIKSRKISLKLTKKQKKQLDVWSGVARYVYNRTVDYISLKTGFGEPLEKWNLVFNEINKQLPEWCDTTPYQIKKMACKDAFKARTSSLALLKNKKIKFFKLNYRTKLKKNSMYIPKDAVKSKGIYYTLLGETKFKENLPIIEYDCRLVEEHGEYFLCVPYKQTVAKFDNQEVLSKAVAIDQGVRSFITYYSEDSVGKIGNEDHVTLFILCKRIDDLISKTKLSKGFKNRKKRKSYKKAMNRLKTKLRNLVDELHWKSINFLVKNYNVIICPNFKVNNMVLDDVKRKISSKTVRNMLNFRFYVFKERLKLKCKEKGCVLIETSEEFTSQIASWTGERIKDIGGSKEIKSEGIVVDRDYNGARNIFIKCIQENLDELKIN